MWQYSAGTLLKESEVTLDIRPTFSLSIQGGGGARFFFGGFG